MLVFSLQKQRARLKDDCTSSEEEHLTKGRKSALKRDVGLTVKKMLTEERKFACAQTSITAWRTIKQAGGGGGTRTFADQTQTASEIPS